MAKVGLIIVGLFVLSLVSNAMFPTKAPIEGLAVPAPAPIVKSPEEVKRSANLSLAAISAASVQDASKDPRSFEVSSVNVHPDGTTCIVYRARNSFNAMLQGRAVRPPNTPGLLSQETHGNRFVAAWNRGCLKPDGQEFARDVTQILAMKR